MLTYAELPVFSRGAIRSAYAFCLPLFENRAGDAS
jgi:hypothetical protein